MRLLYLTINGLNLFKDGLEIDLIARQKVTENNDSGLTHLTGNIYKQNILGIIGINASGKTTALRWISFVLDIYLKEGKVTDEKYNSLLNDSAINIDAFFSDDIFVYKISSALINLNNEYVFKEEILSKKKLTKSISRSKLLEFEDNHIVFTRSKQQSLFLSDNMSIMISQTKNQPKPTKVMDLLLDTNLNIMRVLGDIPAPIIQFLDSSIEYVKSELNTKEHIRLKFKRQKEEIFIHSPAELFYYLSSGTIKGLNVFAAIKLTLQSGGVLLIDEIENHFNQAIVQTILDMFKHPKINTEGATIIFTTHYAELLDDFDRSDSIYIAFKEDSLSLRSLHEFSIRNEYKKSDMYKSSYVGKTAPSYDAYMDLKKHYIHLSKNAEKTEDNINA